MFKTLFRTTAALVALVSVQPALANAGVRLTNSVSRVELQTAANGTVERKILPATMVTPGDQLIFTISYQNNGAQKASQFKITNPLPHSVEYTGAEDETAEVSVDSGATFGKLGQLSVKNADGSLRPALPGDVTHLRWTLPTDLQPGGSGQVSFNARLK